ncbi:MAG: hypothetical protein AAB609_03590 [Patescibacteria group bacterium]
MKKIKRIKRNKYKPKKDNPLVKKQHEFNITPTDRVINTYMIDSKKLREITSISYECLINGEWVTIVYYDNDKSHSDRLHVHFKISYQNQEYEAPQSKNVRQKGTARRLNTWAVEDLKNNYIIYKRKFFKRSNLDELDH